MKNVLNYFVRKAFGFKSTATAEDKTLFGHLLRIRQNIQGVYDWLYGRLSGSVDGTVLKRMPMTEAVVDPNGNMEPLRLRPVLQNTDTLLPHLRLLDGRKITNGYADGTPADDGLPDGVSLARLLCDSSLQPTELIDDNVGWVMDKTLTTSATKVTLNCVRATANVIKDNSTIEELNIHYLESVPTANGSYLFNNLKALKYFYAPNLKQLSSGQSNNLSGLTNCKFIDMPELTDMWNGYNCYQMCNNPVLEYINIPKFDTAQNITQQAYMCNNPELKRVVMGKLKQLQIRDNRNDAIFYNCPKLIHLEIGEGTAISLRLSAWSPTLYSSLSLFLDNFLHFIAERVAEGNYTLTLSAAVYAALEEQEGQTILALLNTKGWTVASA